MVLSAARGADKEAAEEMLLLLEAEGKDIPRAAAAEARANGEESGQGAGGVSINAGNGPRGKLAGLNVRNCIGSMT